MVQVRASTGTVVHMPYNTQFYLSILRGVICKILDNGCYDVRYADGALTTTGDILLVLREQV